MKKSSISRSSTEAEYISVVSTIIEIIWIESQLKELQIKTDSKTTPWCENLSSISLIANPILTKIWS